MRLNENWKLRDFNVGEERDLEVASLSMSIISG